MPSSACSPSPLLALPREIRDQILYDLFSLPSTLPAVQRRIEVRHLKTYIGTPFSLSILFSHHGILLVNSQLSHEGIQALFKHHRIPFVCGPKVLLEVLKGMEVEAKTWLKDVELSWCTMPRSMLVDADIVLDEIERKEVAPLFEYLGSKEGGLRVKTLTVPLHFLSDRRHSLPSSAWYWVVVAAYGINLLLQEKEGPRWQTATEGGASVSLEQLAALGQEAETIKRCPCCRCMLSYNCRHHGCGLICNSLNSSFSIPGLSHIQRTSSSPLETLRIRYEPFDLWATLQPQVDIQAMPHCPSGDWDRSKHLAIRALEAEVSGKVGRQFDIREVLHSVRVQETEMVGKEGWEVVLELRKGGGWEGVKLR